MKTAWSPPEPIGILFNRLFDGKHFSEEAGDKIEDSVLTRSDTTRFLLLVSSSKHVTNGVS